MEKKNRKILMLSPMLIGETEGYARSRTRST